MPTYNYGRFIGTAIDSVLGQAPGGVEVIVLDGGSTDDTREIVTPLAEKNLLSNIFVRRRAAELIRTSPAAWNSRPATIAGCCPRTMR